MSPTPFQSTLPSGTPAHYVILNHKNPEFESCLWIETAQVQMCANMMQCLAKLRPIHAQKRIYTPSTIDDLNFNLGEPKAALPVGTTTRGPFVRSTEQKSFPSRTHRHPQRRDPDICTLNRSRGALGIFFPEGWISNRYPPCGTGLNSPLKRYACAVAGCTSYDFVNWLGIWGGRGYYSSRQACHICSSESHEYSSVGGGYWPPHRSWDSRTINAYGEKLAHVGVQAAAPMILGQTASKARPQKDCVSRLHHRQLQALAYMIREENMTHDSTGESIVSFRFLPTYE
ncbi:hypothetical protein AG1IA_03418 [Rhizoctonia solani AG-1 IA]|uniref:Uncharacterized protein n=1 Tax=Thanatephorus cucumeris (strain AG1-IA) TaxID=983506 RepID=L8WWT2_THACA|nr:hypothetical protein AG1IA_03418 [Rhizoctonia solani AG-1 IA]